MRLEELLESNEYLDYLTAVKLYSWIQKTILNSGPDAATEELIIHILKRKESTYNPKKGGLLQYLKASIKLDLLKNTTTRFIDYYSLQHNEMYNEVEVDMSKFSDQEIVAMYRVSKGKGSTKDIEIVKGLVNE